MRIDEGEVRVRKPPRCPSPLPRICATSRAGGQYCPIARGAEIFAERWTPLIIRNLHLGCASFSEILEGAPGLSRTLLSQLLQPL